MIGRRARPSDTVFSPAFGRPEEPHGAGPVPSSARLRSDRAARPMVAAADRGLRGAVDVHRLLDLGGLPGKPLHLRPLPFSVLFPRAVRRLSACVVRPEALAVA